jgi:hypothetical protein
MPGYKHKTSESGTKKPRLDLVSFNIKSIVKQGDELGDQKLSSL